MESMMNTSTMIVVGAVLTVALIGQSVLLWRLTRSLGGVQKLDEKLGHFGDALSLLTETTESGFKAVAAELDRSTIAGAADGSAKTAIKKAALPARTSSARISAAARRGRTVPEIAASEEMSEGEVRLRLHLAKQSQTSSTTATAAKTTTTTTTATRRTRTTGIAAKTNGTASKTNGAVPKPQETANGSVRA